MSLLPRTTKPFTTASAEKGADNPNLRKTLRVYGMSDIHLNNHHRPLQGAQDQPHQNRPKVVQFLDEILEQQEKEAAEILLILNGDIFDITGSWPYDVSPLRITHEERVKTVRKALDEIVASNPDVMQRLRQFLHCEDTRIVYVLGNHDRWLNEPGMDETFRDILGLEPGSPRFVMERRFYLPEIGLLALHGDEFDPSCRPPKGAESNLNKAERLDMIFLNGLMERIKLKLSSVNYPPAIARGITETVRSLEYVRPIHHAIDYLYSRLALLKNLPESEETDEPVDETVLDLIFESLSDAFQKPKPSWLDKLLLKLLLKFLSFRVGQLCLHFYISRARFVLKDAYQLTRVRQLIEAEHFEAPARIVYLGHTHRLLFQEIVYHSGFEVKSCLVINAGGHKKTIFYPNPDEIYPAGMMAIEYDRPSEALIANLETNTRRLFLNKDEEEQLF